MNPFSTMKPFQIILLVAFGFLAVLGLVLFANFGGFGGDSAKIGAVTIWGSVPQARMDAALSGLRLGSDEYSGVRYEEHDASSFDAQLAEAIASGSGPDLVLISQEQLLAEQNKLQVIPFSTISERTYVDTYLPIDELFLASNGTYGVPFATDPLMLYYNRTLLTSSGIPLPPSTWEGLTAMVPQITRAAAGTASLSTIPFGTYDNVNSAGAIISLLLLQAGSPISSVTETGPRARLSGSGTEGDSSVAAAALTFFTQFADPVKTVYTWNRSLPASRQAFLAGTLAFYPGFASELPELKAANPNLDFDMTVIPQPQTSTQRVTYARAYAFAVPKVSANPNGALTTAFALADPARAAATVAALSMAPASRASLGVAGTDKYQPVYVPQALYARGWLSPSPSITDRIFSTMISNITSGAMTVGQALDTADQAIDAAL